MLTPSSPVFLHNYHELSDINRILYMVAMRPDWDEERRFFFEGCRDLPGQMYIADRRALYQTILKYGPRTCYEIGTYTGGGSTFFLAQAFKKLGAGRVITLEADPNTHILAAAFYARYLPDLRRHVEFLRGSDTSAFTPFIEAEGGVDCVFLDGAADAEETMRQFHFFEPFFHAGSVLMCHDWETEKQRDLRAHLAERSDWRLETVMGEPESVGFAVLVHEPAG